MGSAGAASFFVALALVGAGPAAAVTGLGVSEAVHSSSLPVQAFTKSKKDGKLASCHAAELGARATGSAGFAKKVGNKAAPVACEQPPRSELPLSNALKHATAAAMAVLG
jgi:hypothetical protein